MSGVELGLLAMVAAVLFAALARWRRRSTDVIGVPPPAVAPAGSPTMLADEVPHSGRGPSMDDAVRLMEAAQDGLSDAEIEAIFPGSEVRRTADGVEISFVETSSTIRALGPDGMTEYASIDEIPDAELREKLRRMMDGPSTEPPPEE